MIRIVLVGLVVVAAGGIGAAIWTSGARSVPSPVSGDFFTAPQDYPTEGGQQMQPHWGSTKGDSDASAD